MAHIHYDPKSTMLVFIDEYGNSSLQASTRPLAHYLSVAVLCVRQNYYREILIPRFHEFKREIFGSSDVYLHYRAIFHRLPPFENVSNEERDKIWKKICGFIGGLDIKLRCVCVDKNALMAKIPLWERNPHRDPYEIALALHLERIVFHLDNLFDGKTRWLARLAVESRNAAQNRLVDEAYVHMRERGHLFFEMQKTTTPERLQAVIPRRDLPFLSKTAGIEGLELVDLVTNPLTWITIHQYNRDMRPLRERDEFFMNQAGHRIDCDRNGRMKGWGLKLYPTK